jgi:O-antigen ligase
VPALNHVSDPVVAFGEFLYTLPIRNPRRLGLLLAQLGLVITTASFCISIAGMNIGLISGLIGCLIARAPLHRLIGVWPFLVTFVGLLGVSTLIHHESHEFFTTLGIPIGLLVAQVALHGAVPGAKKLRTIVTIAIIASILISVTLSLAQFLIGHGTARPFRIDSSGPRLYPTYGFFSIHLTQGGIMGLVFFVLIAVSPKQYPRWMHIALAGAVIGVVISGTRSALLGLVGGLCIWIAARGRNFFLIAGGVAIGVLIFGLALLHLTQPERLNSMLSLRDGRWPIWRTSLQIIAEHPVTGTGGASFQEVYRATYPQVITDIPTEFPKGAAHAHNTQLSHAAEHGIPFALGWIFLLATPVIFLWRQRHLQPEIFRSALGLAVMALVFGQFEKLDGECSRVLWTGLGIMLALASHSPWPKTTEEGQSSEMEKPTVSK